jgi:TP901 family phage tail tape measure protein
MADTTYKVRTKFEGDRRGAREQERDFDKVGKSSDRAAEKSAKLQKTLKLVKLAMAAAAAAAAALAIAIGSIITAAGLVKFAQFEKGLSNVRAVSSATTEELDLLKQAALDAAAALPFNTKEATEALYALASAGFTVREQIEALQPVLQLAAATQGDLGAAAEQVVIALRGFQLGAEQSGRVADVLVASTQKSALNAERLTGALANSAAVANAYGQTLEGTVAALGILTTSLSDGSVAGTSLLGSWIQMTDQAKKLGITIKDSAGNMKPLVEIIGEIERKGISAEQVMDAFGARGGKAMSILVSQGSRALRQMEADLVSQGQAATLTAQQLDNLAGDVTRLTSALDVFTVLLGEKAAPAARRFARLLLEQVQMMIAFMERNAEVIEEKFSAAIDFLAAAFVRTIKITIGLIKVLDDLAVAIVTMVAVLKTQAIVQWLALQQALARAAIGIQGTSVAINAMTKAQIAWAAVTTTVTGVLSKLVALFSGPGAIAILVAAFVVSVRNSVKGAQEAERALDRYKRVIKETASEIENIVRKEDDWIQKKIASATATSLQLKVELQLLNQRLREEQARLTDPVAAEAGRASGSRKRFEEIGKRLEAVFKEIQATDEMIERLRTMAEEEKLLGDAIDKKLDLELERLRLLEEAKAAQAKLTKEYEKAVGKLTANVELLRHQSDLLASGAVSMFEFRVQTEAQKTAMEAGLKQANQEIIDKTRERLELEREVTEQVAVRTRIEALQEQTEHYKRLGEAIREGTIDLDLSNLEMYISLIEKGVDVTDPMVQTQIRLQQVLGDTRAEFEAMAKVNTAKKLKELQIAFLALIPILLLTNPALAEFFEEIVKGIEAAIAKIEGMTDATRTELDKAEELWKSFSRSVQSSFADAIERMLNGQTNSFEDFFDNILQLFKRMIAEMIAYAIAQKIIIPIQAKVLGEGGQGGFFGEGGSGFGGLHEMLGKGGFGNFGGEGFGAAMFGALGIGAGIGGIVGGFTGSSEAGAIGGAIGAVIGTMIFPVIGTYVGAVIGGAIGGILGKEQTPKGFAELVVADGMLKVGRTGGELAAQAEMIGSAIGQEVNDIISGSIGGILTGLTAEIKIVQKGKWTRVYVDGVMESFKDAQEAIDFAIAQAIQNADIIGISDIMAAALQGFSGESVEDLERAIEVAKKIEALAFGEGVQGVRMAFAEIHALLQEGAALGISAADLARAEAAAIRQVAHDLQGIDTGDFADRIRGMAEFTEQLNRRSAELVAEMARIQAEIERQREGGGGLADITGVDLMTPLAGLPGDLKDRLLGPLADTLGTSIEELEAQFETLQDLLDSLPEAVNMAEFAERVIAEFAGLDQGVTSSLLSIIETAEEIRQAVIDLGLSAEETAALLAQVSEAERMRLQALETEVIERFLNAMERAGVETERVAQLRAELEQAKFQIELKTVELQLNALGLMTAAFEQMLNAAADWAEDLGNFFDVNIKLPKGFGKGGGKTDFEEDTEAAMERLEEFLLGFELTDFQFQLFQLKKRFKEAADEAKELGFDLERVRMAEAKAIRELIDSIFDPIVEFQRELAGGDLSPIDPASQFLVQQQQFEELRARALAGDVDAIGEFPAAARQFLQLAAAFFGTSSGAYRAIFEAVETDLDQILLQRDSILEATLDEGTLAQLDRMDTTNDLLSQILEVLDMFGGGLQHGGQVDPGKFYVVGEKGPEFFTPTGMGKVLPFPKAIAAASPTPRRQPTLSAQEDARVFKREMGKLVRETTKAGESTARVQSEAKKELQATKTEISAMRADIQAMNTRMKRLTAQLESRERKARAV